MLNQCKEPSKFQLKNKLAQDLLEQEVIILEGKEVKLWTGPSSSNIQLQEAWNKIKSYTELNDNTTGENGSVVFTGKMQMQRQEIAYCATKLGFNVHSSVSRNTDYLIFGTENVSPTKVAESIELNAQGANIQFVDEDAFLRLIFDNFDLVSLPLPLIPQDAKVAVKEVQPKKKRATNIHKLPQSTILEGKRIVISGVFSHYSREEYKELIELNGGKETTSISSKTSFILAGDNVGPIKLKKARELDLSIVREGDFLLMIGE
jgi:NAD-dependent DNA ligase